MRVKFSTEKILILGSSGLLGRSLAPFLENNGHHVELHGRANIATHHADISDASDTFSLLDLINPTVIVNLVGLTDVDRCETQPNQAYLTNVRTVENVSDWIKQKKALCHLVHISTDQVYDGIGPHTEKQVTLTNYYAFSKYAGELAAATVPSATFRTNFFGRSHCANRLSLTDWLFRALSDGDPIQVFEDVLFSPLSMITLSKMIEQAIQKRTVGVFNLGSQDGLSKADFAFAFAEEMCFPVHRMTRTSIEQATFLKTYRPRDMRMVCSKFESELGIELPHLRDQIKQVAKEYREVA